MNSEISSDETEEELGRRADFLGVQNLIVTAAAAVQLKSFHQMLINKLIQLKASERQKYAETQFWIPVKLNRVNPLIPC